MVPKTRAEAPVRSGGAKVLQAEGPWKGTIDAVRVRPFPNFIGKDIEDGKERGYSSGDGEILSIEIGSNVPLKEGMEDYGARKRFVDFVIRDGTATVSDVIPEDSWQMQRSAALLANLALALGATEELTDDQENVFVVTSEDFLETLKGEGFNSQIVGYTVAHRPWTSKEGKKGTDDEVTEFFTAV